MSQAQALLDCAADLVVQCGVLGAVDVLQVISAAEDMSRSLRTCSSF